MRHRHISCGVWVDVVGEFDASTCDDAASGTPSRRRPTARRPVHAKARGATRLGRRAGHEAPYRRTGNPAATGVIWIRARSPGQFLGVALTLLNWVKPPTHPPGRRVDLFPGLVRIRSQTPASRRDTWSPTWSAAAADSRAVSSPGNRASRSCRRSVTKHRVPSCLVCVTPASRRTFKWWLRVDFAMGARSSPHPCSLPSASTRTIPSRVGSLSAPTTRGSMISSFAGDAVWSCTRPRYLPRRPGCTRSRVPAVA